MLLLHVCRGSRTLTLAYLGFFTLSTSKVSLADRLRLVLTVTKLRPLTPAEIRLNLAESE